MSDFDDENDPDGKALAVGGPVRVARLSDLVSIRAELGRLYREARRRHGRFPDALVAQRLANVLGGVRDLVMLEDIERRLAELEKRGGRR
jgi:hypothetical protein